MSNAIGTIIYFVLGIIALPWMVAWFIIACLFCLLLDLGEFVARSFVHTFKTLTQEVR